MTGSSVADVTLLETFTMPAPFGDFSPVAPRLRAPRLRSPGSALCGVMACGLIALAAPLTAPAAQAAEPGVNAPARTAQAAPAPTPLPAPSQTPSAAPAPSAVPLPVPAPVPPSAATTQVAPEASADTALVLACKQKALGILKQRSSSIEDIFIDMDGLTIAKSDVSVGETKVRHVMMGEAYIQREQTDKVHRFLCLTGDDGKVLMTFFTER